MIDIKNNRFKLWFMVERKKGPGYKILRSRPIKAKTLTAMHKEINDYACSINDGTADEVILVRCNSGSNETYFIGPIYKYPKPPISMTRLKKILTIVEPYLTSEV